MQGNFENDADLISFDFFDTVISRDCVDPINIFNRVENKIGSRGWAKKREQAELQVRHRSWLAGRQEVSIGEIHKELLGESCIQLEIETELESWILNKRAVELIREFQGRGKKVIILSDIYLSSQVLDNFLTSNGIYVHEVVTSSDLGLTKNSGDLFEFISNSYNVDFSKWIHYGDNVHSDVEMASRLGIQAIHWRSIKDILLSTLGRDSFIERIHNKVDSNFSTLAGEKLPDVAHAIGIRYVHPTATAFVDWLSEQSQLDQIENFVFLGRDAWLFWKVACLKGQHFTNENSKYYSVSRRAVFPLRTAEDIETEIRSLSDLPVNEINVAMGFPGRHMNTDQIRAEIFAEKSIFLQSKLADFLRTKKNVAIVDIGWHGSNFKALKNEFESVKRGYFLGLYPEKHDDDSTVGFYFDKNTGEEAAVALRQGIEVIENLFSEPAPSVLRFEFEDEALIEKFAMRAYELEANAHHFISKVHDAVIQSHCDSAPFSREEALLTLLELVTNPTQKEAAALAEFPTSIRAGNTIPEKLLSTNTFEFWVPGRSVYGNAEQIEEEANMVFVVGLRKVWRKTPASWRRFVGQKLNKFIYGTSLKVIRENIPDELKKKILRVTGL